VKNFAGGDPGIIDNGKGTGGNTNNGNCCTSVIHCWWC
jgi:hypothetical protein